MREILFRGKRIDNGEWVFGSLLAWRDGDTDICCHNSDNNGEMDKVIVRPETVGQFTGLTDKNGKKIFEGDILRFSYTGKNHGVEGTEAVVFKSGKFGVEWGWHKELVALDGFANTTIEVIGNIHDNPDLLEVEDG